MASTGSRLPRDTVPIRFDDFQAKEHQPGQAQDDNPSHEPGQDEKHPKRHRRSIQPRTTRYRFLSPTEWSILARGVGAVDLGDLECQAPTTPSSSIFCPGRGMPEGLYKDIVIHRNKFFLYFHIVSILRWVGMLLQLFISAALTGIGSMDLDSGTAITVMAASNTIIAGILAMLHNSGLPDRYRYNQTEFEEVEDYLKMLLRTGVVEESMTVDQVLVECFNAYHEARAVTSRNDPAFYLRAHRSNEGKFPGGSGDMNEGGPISGPALPAPPMPPRHSPAPQPTDDGAVQGPSKSARPGI